MPLLYFQNLSYGKYGYMAAKEKSPGGLFPFVLKILSWSEEDYCFGGSTNKTLTALPGRYLSLL